MTHLERLTTLSAVCCCICDRILTVQELQEFEALADDPVRGEAHCRTCAESHLHLCHECSSRFVGAAGELCEECTATEYGLAV
jgi:hypothetical protein